MALSVLGILAAYLIGAIPVGFLVARAAGGTDIRRAGSGNIGATNVLRTLGVGPAVLTLVGDIVKGYLAVSDKVQVTAAETRENLEDLVAEARAEAGTERTAAL